MARSDAQGWQLEVLDAAGCRVYTAEQLPLRLGSHQNGDESGRTDPPSAVQLPGETDVAAWLGLAEGDLFIQPEEGRAIVCQGRRTETSHWIQSGDLIGIGANRLRFEGVRSGLKLTVESSDQANRTEPPAGLPILVPPSGPRPAANVTSTPEAAFDAAEEPVAPGVKSIDFQPARSSARPRRSSGSSWAKLVTALVLLLLAGVATALFTARSVGFQVEPPPDHFAISSGWVIPLGDRYLMWPGQYPVRAEKAGYQDLETDIDVGSPARQDIELTMAMLPGILEVVAADGPNGIAIKDIAVTLDGEPVGVSPLELELDAGSYRVGVTDERYRPFETQLKLEGRGRRQKVEAVLEPRWARVQLDSRPSGARIQMDGETLGTTPAELELIEGVRRFQLVLPGYKPYRNKLEVVAGEAMAIGPVSLRPSDGNLVITSNPSDADVTVGGIYRGRTPLDLFLPPGQSHRLRVNKAGYRGAEQAVAVKSGQASELNLTLEALQGQVSVNIFPPGAEILVDGEPVVPVDDQLQLSAQPHSIEVRKAGFISFKTEINPLPGIPQNLEVRLESESAAQEREVQSRLQTVEGHRLALVEPGRLRMGASRREAGRRANEILREVELTRRFYAGVHEVSNRQFRRFKAQHLSGGVGGKNLELDHHPVVRVTWQEAVAYCNWLSDREGLPAAYVQRGETWVPAEPMTTGFRLPTEAEWSWLARYSLEGEGPRKYSWGAGLPPTEGAGNFADQSAESVVESVLSNYRDGFPVTAPVDSFAPDSRGIYQLGGNVAEWVHDVYKVRAAMVGAVERDPMGPPTGEMHVIRGAGWMHSTVTELRLSFRDYGSDARPDLGFRIARYAEGVVP